MGNGSCSEMNGSKLLSSENKSTEEERQCMLSASEILIDVVKTSNNRNWIGCIEFSFAGTSTHTKADAEELLNFRRPSNA